MKVYYTVIEHKLHVKHKLLIKHKSHSIFEHKGYFTAYFIHLCSEFHVCFCGGDCAKRCGNCAKGSEQLRAA